LRCCCRSTLALPLIMGVISCILLFVHHLHLLLYVPTIGLIVLRGRWPTAASICALFCWPDGCQRRDRRLFLRSCLPWQRAVPVDQFTAALRARAIDSPEKIGGYLVQVFYTDIAHEIEETMKGLPNNALRFPVYAILIFLHLPLISYFRRLNALSAAAPGPPHGRLRVSWASRLAMSSYGVFVFDYPRWSPTGPSA